jgi:hypothetical protein
MGIRLTGEWKSATTPAQGDQRLDSSSSTDIDLRLFANLAELPESTPS